MPQSSEEKRDRFARMFPDRCRRLAKTATLLVNCTKKSQYEWDKDVVARCWVEVAKVFRTVAKSYGVEFVVTLNGYEVEYLNTSKKLQDQVSFDL